MTARQCALKEAAAILFISNSLSWSLYRGLVEKHLLTLARLVKLTDEPTEVAQFSRQRFESLQIERVRAVRQSARWMVVHFHEDSVGARRDARAGQRLDELGLASAARALGAGQLQRVCD